MFGHFLEKQYDLKNWCCNNDCCTVGSGHGSPLGGGSGYSGGPPGVLLRWSQRRHSLALAGAAPTVRLWDALAERLQADVPVGTAAPATALWRGGSVLAAGFADGTVRVWDERELAAPAPAHTLAAHSAPVSIPLAGCVLCEPVHTILNRYRSTQVLAAVRRTDLHCMVSACADGEVRFYDTRKMQVTHVVRAPAPLAAVDVHPCAGLLAWYIYSYSGSRYLLI